MMSTIVHHDHRSPWLRFWSLLRTKLTRFLSNQSTRSSFLQHLKFDGLFSNSAVYLIFPTIKLNPSARRHWREAEGLTTPCPAEVIHRSHQQSCKDQHPDNNACYRAGAHLGFVVSGRCSSCWLCGRSRRSGRRWRRWRSWSGGTWHPLRLWFVLAQ